MRPTGSQWNSRAEGFKRDWEGVKMAKKRSVFAWQFAVGILEIDTE